VYWFHWLFLSEKLHMRKDRLYFLTLAGITLTVISISIFSVNYLINTATGQLLKVQLEGSKREAFQIAKILETQLSYGIPKEAVAAGLQRSIENTDMASGFICMYNTSGFEICHPDPARIGQKITTGNSFLHGSNGAEKNFLEILMDGKESGGVRNFTQQRRSEIIYVYPVSGTDWMLAAHANISSLQEQLAAVRFNIILVSGLASLLIILVSFMIVRWLGSKYEQGIESEKDQLIDDLRSIAKLNSQVNEYRQRIEQQIPVQAKANTQPAEATIRKRILTYWRDELKSIAVDEIAFLYTQNGLTYVHCLTTEVYNSSASLEELFESLDPAMFFRANRQFIISIRSIEKVFRYGNNQLKIVTNPLSAEEIIISKNKAAEFKDWLNS
jgi:hypothetical protein